jgi:hypothetical protein
MNLVEEVENDDIALEIFMVVVVEGVLSVFLFVVLPHS